MLKIGITHTISGQILLIISCVFYLLWWRISYRPDITVNRTAGVNGVLLLITAGSGIAGLILSVIGVNTLPVLSRPKLSGVWVVTVGIVVYIILIIVTKRVFHRPVTTELFLITGWTVLEFVVLSATNASGNLSDHRFRILSIVIAAAFAVSLVLYVLYYKMEPLKAFYTAMVPLVSEAVAMTCVVLMIAL